MCTSTCLARPALSWTPVGHELKNQRYHGKHQQYVDEPAERKAAHNAKEPQDEQDDKQRPQHRLTPEIFSFCVCLLVDKVPASRDKLLTFVSSRGNRKQPLIARVKYG